MKKKMNMKKKIMIMIIIGKIMNMIIEINSRKEKDRVLMRINVHIIIIFGTAELFVSIARDSVGMK